MDDPTTFSSNDFFRPSPVSSPLIRLRTLDRRKSPIAPLEPEPKSGSLSHSSPSSGAAPNELFDRTAIPTIRTHEASIRRSALSPIRRNSQATSRAESPTAQPRGSTPQPDRSLNGSMLTGSQGGAGSQGDLYPSLYQDVSRPFDVNEARLDSSLYDTNRSRTRSRSRVRQITKYLPFRRGSRSSMKSSRRGSLAPPHSDVSASHLDSSSAPSGILITPPGHGRPNLNLTSPPPSWTNVQQHVAHPGEQVSYGGGGGESAATTAAATAGKKKKGLLKRMFGGSSKKKAENESQLDLGARLQAEEEEKRSSASRRGSMALTGSRRSSKSSSFRDLFRISSHRHRKASSHMSGLSSADNQSIPPSASFLAPPADESFLIPEEGKKKRWYSKIVGSSRKRKGSASLTRSDNVAKHSVSFNRDPSIHSFPILRDTPMVDSTSKPATSMILKIPTTATDAQESAASVPTKKKKKKGWGIWGSSSKSKSGTKSTKAPEGTSPAEDLPEGMNLEALFTEAPAAQTVERPTGPEITHHTIEAEEQERLQHLQEQTRDEFLKALREIMKLFLIRQGKHCLWKHEQLNKLLAQNTVVDQTNTGPDEFGIRKFLDAQEEKKKEETLQQAKALQQTGQQLVYCAQTGALQDLKRADWRIVCVQEQVDAMRVATTMTQLARLIYNMFDDAEYRKAMAAVYQQHESQIESWVNDGYLQQPHESSRLSPDDFRKIGQLRQGKLILEHMDDMMSKAADTSTNTYYTEMMTLSREIENLRNRMAQIISAAFDYMKSNLVPDSPNNIKRFLMDPNPAIQSFILPNFITRKLRVLDDASPPDQRVHASASDLVRRKEDILRRLSRAQRAPVGEGFALTASRDQLEDCEKRLAGKWGSYRLFEQWLHDSMKWQWQDVNASRQAFESRTDLERAIEAKKTQVVQMVEKKLTQLWAGRAQVAKEDAVERLQKYLLEAIHQRPPLYITAEAQDLERRSMAAEEQRASLLRVLEGPVGRDLLRKSPDYLKKNQLAIQGVDDVDRILMFARDIRVAIESDRTIINDVELQTILEDLEVETGKMWQSVAHIKKARESKEASMAKKREAGEKKLAEAKCALETQRKKLAEIDAADVEDLEEELAEVNAQLAKTRSQILSASEERKQSKEKAKELKDAIKENKRLLTVETKKMKQLEKERSLARASESNLAIKLHLQGGPKSPSLLPPDGVSSRASSDEKSNVLSMSALETTKPKKSKKWYSIIPVGSSSKKTAGSSAPPLPPRASTSLSQNAPPATEFPSGGSAQMDPLAVALSYPPHVYPLPSTSMTAEPSQTEKGPTLASAPVPASTLRRSHERSALSNEMAVESPEPPAGDELSPDASPIVSSPTQAMPTHSRDDSIIVPNIGFSRAEDRIPSRSEGTASALGRSATGIGRVNVPNLPLSGLSEPTPSGYKDRDPEPVYATVSSDGQSEIPLGEKKKKKKSVLQKILGTGGGSKSKPGRVSSGQHQSRLGAPPERRDSASEPIGDRNSELASQPSLQPSPSDASNAGKKKKKGWWRLKGRSTTQKTRNASTDGDKGSCATVSAVNATQRMEQWRMMSLQRRSAGSDNGYNTHERRSPSLERFRHTESIDTVVIDPPPPLFFMEDRAESLERSSSPPAKSFTIHTPPASVGEVDQSQDSHQVIIPPTYIASSASSSPFAPVTVASPPVVHSLTPPSSPIHSPRRLEPSRVGASDESANDADRSNDTGSGHHQETPEASPPNTHRSDRAEEQEPNRFESAERKVSIDSSDRRAGVSPRFGQSELSPRTDLSLELHEPHRSRMPSYSSFAPTRRRYPGTDAESEDAHRLRRMLEDIDEIRSDRSSPLSDPPVTEQIVPRKNQSVTWRPRVDISEFVAPNTESRSSTPSASISTVPQTNVAAVLTEENVRKQSDEVSTPVVPPTEDVDDHSEAGQSKVSKKSSKSMISWLGLGSKYRKKRHMSTGDLEGLDAVVKDRAADESEEATNVDIAADAKTFRSADTIRKDQISIEKSESSYNGTHSAEMASASDHKEQNSGDHRPVYEPRPRRPSSSCRVLFQEDFGTEAVPLLADLLPRWEITCLLSAEERLSVERLAEIRHVEPNDVIWRAGDKLTHLVCVQGGRLRGVDPATASLGRHTGSEGNIHQEEESNERVMEDYRPADMIFDRELADWITKRPNTPEPPEAPLDVTASSPSIIWRLPVDTIRSAVEKSRTRVTVQLAKRLRSIGLLRNLTSEELLALASNLKPRLMCQAGSLLGGEKSPTRSFWLVWQGCMVATDPSNERMEQYHQYDVFGLEAFQENAPQAQVDLSAQEHPTIVFKVTVEDVENAANDLLANVAARFPNKESDLPSMMASMESVSVIGDAYKRKKKKRGLAGVLTPAAKLLGMKSSSSKPTSRSMVGSPSKAPPHRGSGRIKGSDDGGLRALTEES